MWNKEGNGEKERNSNSKQKPQQKKNTKRNEKSVIDLFEKKTVLKKDEEKKFCAKSAANIFLIKFLLKEKQRFFGFFFIFSLAYNGEYEKYIRKQGV